MILLLKHAKSNLTVSKEKCIHLQKQCTKNAANVITGEHRKSWEDKCETTAAKIHGIDAGRIVFLLDISHNKNLRAKSLDSVVKFTTRFEYMFTVDVFTQERKIKKKNSWH